jgi:hypothetical protein
MEEGKNGRPAPTRVLGRAISVTLATADGLTVPQADGCKPGAASGEPVA